MTEKQIRDEAMRKVMWEVGHTNNDVTRYISDAVANQVVRDESGGWIPVTERLPSIFEYSGCKECEKYYRKLEIAVQTDTLEYYFGYFDGYKWFDMRHRCFNGDVAAWKVHQPFSPQN